MSASWSGSGSGGTLPQEPEVWLLADGPEQAVRLLEAARHAELVGSLVSLRDLMLPPVTDGPALIVVAAAALPAAIGTSLLLGLRARLVEVPIVVISETGTEDWYGVGATAVLPATSPSEVIAAQLQAIAWWSDPLEPELILGLFRYHPGRRSVEVGGRPVECSSTQRRLLAALLRARGEVVDSGHLRRLIGSTSRARGNAAIATSIRRLRQRLDAVVPELGSCVRTVRGEGFLLDPDRAMEIYGRAMHARGGDYRAKEGFHQ